MSGLLSTVYISLSLSLFIYLCVLCICTYGLFDHHSDGKIWMGLTLKWIKSQQTIWMLPSERWSKRVITHIYSQFDCLCHGTFWLAHDFLMLYFNGSVWETRFLTLAVFFFFPPFFLVCSCRFLQSSEFALWYPYRVLYSRELSYNDCRAQVCVLNKLL